MEARLKRPIPHLQPDLSLPPEISARLAGSGNVYGQQRGGGVSKEVGEHLAAIAGSVQARGGRPPGLGWEPQPSPYPSLPRPPCQFHPCQCQCHLHISPSRQYVEATQNTAAYTPERADLPLGLVMITDACH